MIVREDKSILYRFSPRMARAARFEKLGEGPGYIWGFGTGYLEYVVPAREDRRRVSEIVVRARIQPVLPIDAKPADIKTRVTLFVNGRDCGSRLIPVEPIGQPSIQEWRVDNLCPATRHAWLAPDDSLRGHPESDWLYGMNISNWPEGYESHDAKPVEVEVRR